MNINNALVNGKKVNIKIENGVIKSLSKRRLKNAYDAEGMRVIPGLIDTHTHGCIGHDTMDADFEEMCRFYASHGTTSWLPTTLTASKEELSAVNSAKTDYYGANILGFHLEGPYISEKYKGAQNPEFIRRASIEEIKGYKNIKKISLAPEIEGSMEFIRQISKDCIVSIAHTECDYETAIEAIENGASCLTHTFNAMAGLHHRNPGPIAAAFEKHIYAEIICDGLHIARPMILLAYKLFGSDRMVLVSDSLRSAYMPDGEYNMAGLEITLKNNEARLKDGTIAGSSATLWDCVKKAVEFGIPFEEAVKMASTTPAEQLGVKKGKIETGYDADLLIIDDNFTIREVFIAGEKFQ